MTITNFAGSASYIVRIVLACVTSVVREKISYVSNPTASNPYNADEIREPFRFEAGRKYNATVISIWRDGEPTANTMVAVETGGASHVILTAADFVDAGMTTPTHLFELARVIDRACAWNETGQPSLC